MKCSFSMTAWQIWHEWAMSYTCTSGVSNRVYKVCGLGNSSCAETQRRRALGKIQLITRHLLCACVCVCVRVRVCVCARARTCTTFSRMSNVFCKAQNQSSWGSVHLNLATGTYEPWLRDLDRASENVTAGGVGCTVITICEIIIAAKTPPGCSYVYRACWRRCATACSNQDVWLCFYICVYIYICKYVYTHIYVYIHIYIYMLNTK